MKSTVTRLLVLSISLVFAIGMWAQDPIAFRPYYWNGFEDATENANWTMVSDNSNPLNKWVVGSAMSSISTNSTKLLYISYDNGTSAGFNGNGSTVIMAYRDFTIPAGGTYSFYLDYKHKAEAGDSLFICWVDDPSVNIPTTTTGVLPSWVKQYAKKIDVIDVKSNYWKVSSFTVCGGSAGKLVFVWKKSNPSSSVNNIPAEIGVDNVQLNKNSPLRYFTGFDSAEEMQGWTLHNTPEFGSVVNKWVIGSSVSMSNQNSLYISKDNSNFSYDGSAEGIVSAVKDFTLPAGELFNIEFDFICGGDAQDYMHVAWLDSPTDSSFYNWASSGSIPSPTISSNAKIVVKDGKPKVSRMPAWTHAAFQVEGIGRPVRLVFYWVNNSKKTYNPPVAIDNFLLTRGLDNSSIHQEILPAPCATPIISEAKAIGGGIVVSWDDDGTSTYEIAYRNTYDTLDGIFQTVNNVRSPYTINNLGKGSYSVFVRKVCMGSYTQCGVTVNDTSAWATKHQLVVLTGEGCINYGDITNPQVATASISAGKWTPPAVNQAFSQELNPESIAGEGRHKVITTMEYDPRTVTNESSDTILPGLLTIPYGELATVKLGNEITGAQCEGLVYKLNVSPEHALLIMRYAVVLQDPRHTPSEQPRFRLEILDHANNLISPTCGNIQFVPGTNTQNWNVVAKNSDTIRWKDWSTIGLNLSQYVGQEIKIRLSTWDCSLSGHYGYAYFMLNCVPQAFSGFSCRTDKVDTIYAPAGFSYCWFKKYNPDGTIAHTEHDSLNTITCLSDKRGFVPSSTSDTSTYVCKIMLKTEAGTMQSCYFGLTTRLAPRVPKARNSYSVVQKDCQNKVQLNDSSVVYIGDVNSGQTEPTNGVRWVVRKGGPSGPIIFRTTESNPLMIFPNEASSYHITQIALYTRACNDTATFTIDVPRIGNIIKNSRVITCDQRLPYMWRGRALTVDGQYQDIVHMSNGCDSIFNIDFKVESTIQTIIDSTICQGQTVTFEGEVRSKSGTYSKTYSTSVGCDSTVTLNLTVNPVIDISLVPFQAPICADDPQFAIKYTNSGSTAPNRYTLKFEGDGNPFGVSNGTFDINDPQQAIMIPIPAKIRPDNYQVKILFEDTIYKCPGSDINIPFEVKYKSNIIEQNWNDVIAVLNRKYNNGNDQGYEFSEFKWFKNGQEIQGETKSYLYIPGGLEVGADYQVQLTRKGENYPIFTCPVKAQAYSGSTTPTFVSAASPLRVYNLSGKAQVNIYSITGVLVSSQTITPQSSEYVMPSASGVYIVNIRFESGLTKVFKIVVGQ